MKSAYRGYNNNNKNDNNTNNNNNNNNNNNYNNQDLKIEVERLWERKATVVPVVIGALRAIPRDLTKHLITLGLDKITPSQLQKAALLGTAHILQKYL